MVFRCDLSARDRKEPHRWTTLIFAMGCGCSLMATFPVIGVVEAPGRKTTPMVQLDPAATVPPLAGQVPAEAPEARAKLTIGVNASVTPVKSAPPVFASVSI